MDTEIQALNHESIVKLVSEFLVNKPDGNWHKERIRKADLHAHGADLILVGGKRNSEHFIIVQGKIQRIICRFHQQGRLAACFGAIGYKDGHRAYYPMRRQ